MPRAGSAAAASLLSPVGFELVSLFTRRSSGAAEEAVQLGAHRKRKCVASHKLQQLLSPDKRYIYIACMYNLSDCNPVDGQLFLFPLRLLRQRQSP